MITGIGIDLVEIDEIKRSIEQSKRFIKRVFTLDEITYCEQKTSKYQHYAARFAAKEAAMKAIGTGWDKGIQFTHIEIKNSYTGMPFILLHKKAKLLAEERNIKVAHLSISHSGNYATAIVMLES